LFVGIIYLAVLKLVTGEPFCWQMVEMVESL
jgi:hypothetical protein